MCFDKVWHKDNEIKNTMQQKKCKSFVEIYDELPRTRKVAVVTPRRDFIERIAAVTKKSTMTVRGWASKGIAPDALTQAALEKELGVPAAVLFPKQAES